MWWANLITYLLNLFDLYCTMQWVNRFGIGIEGNPIGRFLLETNLAIPVKTIGIGACLIALYAGVKRYPRWKWICWIPLAVYVLLSIYHIITIKEVLQ